MKKLVRQQCVWPWSGSSPLETLSFSSDRNVCVPPWPWALFFDELSGSFCPTQATPLVLFPCSQRHIVSSTIVTLTPGWAAQRTNCPSLFCTNGVLVPTECSTVLIAHCDDFWEQMQKKNQQTAARWKCHLAVLSFTQVLMISRSYHENSFMTSSPVSSLLLCSDIYNV